MILGLALTAGSSATEYIVLPEVKNGDFEAPTGEWISRIESLAPARATVVPDAPRRVLVFSLTTGYEHKVAPHAKAVLRVLGQKTGAFEAVFRDEIGVFEKEELSQFDAVVLNNVCPGAPGRDLFSDVLGSDKETARLEANLIDYVEQGGGLVVIHGGIAFQLNSPEVSEMIGGSFDWHPKFQKIKLDPVDPAHPLVAGFGGRGFVYYDEPYLMKNAYAKKNFRPLLVMDVSALDIATSRKEEVAADIRYMAWIRRHGRGRVFFCSPSHHPASYESGALLQFMLDGIQYALGDLHCDDSPLETD